MEVCGEIEQCATSRLTFHDNMKREDVKWEVRFLQADKSQTLAVTRLSLYTYVFEVTSKERGISILEILADGVQISQSPLRVEITSRNCQDEFGSKLRVANDEGNCVCRAGSIEIFDCISYNIFLLSFVLPVIVILVLCGFAFINYKKKKLDGIWRVKPSDLKFDDPPVVIGRGTFGLVLLSTYRGTTVAVKRVIPPKCKSLLAYCLSRSLKTYVLIIPCLY